MKKIFNEFIRIISEYHNEVVYNVITFKNCFDLRAIPALIVGVFIGMNLSELLFTVFISFYLLDYVTGILATIVELKKNPKKLRERKKRKGTPYWIESDRIVRGIVKAVIYLQLILIVSVLTTVLDNKELVVHSSLIKLTPLQILLILCIASEFVSNLENAKRSGFDLIGRVEKLIKKGWSLINTVKTGKNE